MAPTASVSPSGSFRPDRPSFWSAIVEQVLSVLPLRFFEVISPFLPSTAGTRLIMDDATLEMMDAGRDTVSLTPWEGYGVLVLWTIVLLAAAAVLVRRRDA